MATATNATIDPRAAQIVSRYLKHLWLKRLREEKSQAIELIKEEIRANAAEIGVPWEEFEPVFQTIASEALAEYVGA